ncbi:hypothetical protein [Gymnodinialimonas sp.]
MSASTRILSRERLSQLIALYGPRVLWYGSCAVLGAGAAVCSPEEFARLGAAATIAALAMAGFTLLKIQAERRIISFFGRQSLDNNIRVVARTELENFASQIGLQLNYDQSMPMQRDAMEHAHASKTAFEDVLEKWELDLRTYELSTLLLATTIWGFGDLLLNAFRSWGL